MTPNSRIIISSLPVAERPGEKSNSGGTMKSYEELTDQEKFDLTEEQFSHYCDLVCAEAGAPLRPLDPGPEPEVFKVAPANTFYEVCNHYFVRQEDANAVAELINQCDRRQYDYISGPSYIRALGGKEDPVRVQSEKLMTMEEAHTHLAALQESEKNKNQWEEDKAEYDKQVKARTQALEWIENDRDTAMYRVREIERALDRYQEYLELAEGNKDMALKFHIKAYGNPPDGFYEKADFPVPAGT